MTVLVVGLGSMGRRRIRLIKAYDPKIVVVGVDCSKERCAQAQKIFGITCVSNLEIAAAEWDFQVGFVCTSPNTHYKIIEELLRRDLHVFTELNLINDGYKTLLNLAAEKNRKLFLSSTLLYRREIEEIGKLVAVQSQDMIYIYHVGQYLPDWHPWENYRDFFVGNRRTNGCRELFAVELPWILKAFGPVANVMVSRRKISKLELPYPDSYLVILEHATGHRGTLCVDVVSRSAARRLEVFAENFQLTWKGTPETLCKLDLTQKRMEQITTYDAVNHEAGYDQNIIENAYLEEIQCFFQWVAGQGEPRYSFEQDLKTLALIDQIEGELV